MIVAKVEQLMALVDALETQLAASRAPPLISSKPSWPGSPQRDLGLVEGLAVVGLNEERATQAPPHSDLRRFGGGAGFMPASLKRP